MKAILTSSAYSRRLIGREGTLIISGRKSRGYNLSCLHFLEFRANWMPQLYPDDMLPGSSSSAAGRLFSHCRLESKLLAGQYQARLPPHRGLFRGWMARTEPDLCRPCPCPACSADKQQRRLVFQQGYGGAEEERKAPEGSCGVRRWSVVVE